MKEISVFFFFSKYKYKQLFSDVRYNNIMTGPKHAATVENGNLNEIFSGHAHVIITITIPSRRRRPKKKNQNTTDQNKCEVTAAIK